MLNQQLPSDETATVLAAATAAVRQKAGMFTFAGDALCLAMTALRLKEPTAATPTVPTQATPPIATPSAAPTTIITLDEVSWHDHVSDCWVVVYDGVYNITHFLHEHPGGEEVLSEYAGRDATLSFRGIGHGAAMIRALEPYLVGVLPEAERIFHSPVGSPAGGFMKSRGLL